MESDQEPGLKTRPFWQWLAIALAPGVVSNAVALIVRAYDHVPNRGPETVVLLGMFLLVLMPVLMIPYLIVIARPYLRARGQASVSRVGFVIAFWFANAFLWGASCGVLLNDLRL